MSSVAPVSLQNLYVDLDYLSGIGNNQKYNFIDRTYINDDWIGYLWRKLGGENQDIYGISIMENICKNAAEQWENYKDNTKFNSILLDKMVAARQGLDRCKSTYEQRHKTSTAGNINNRAIMVLDSAIPLERKIEEGITLQTRGRLYSTTKPSTDLANETKTDETKING